MSLTKTRGAEVSTNGDFLRAIGNGGFDPQGDLLVNQAGALDQEIELNLRNLTPFQRALLVIDGTVTKFIEAYTLEPIEIIRLSQISRQLRTDHQGLQASGDTTILVRQVLLRGRYTSTVYAYGLSLIVPDRIGTSVREELEVDGRGLGHILRDNRVETYREVLWYGEEQASDLPDDFRMLTDGKFVSRTYRIVAGGKPMMLIHEKFPCPANAEQA